MIAALGGGIWGSMVKRRDKNIIRLDIYKDRFV